jgi:DNA polymerase type B, organellar and viral
MDIRKPGDARPARRKNMRLVSRKVAKTTDILFGTFDIESYGLGGPYADGATYIPGEGVTRYPTAAELFEALMNPPRGRRPDRKAIRTPFIWVAHNGAGYDFAYIAFMLVNYAVENEITIETVQQGTKPIELTIPTPFGQVKLRDSYPFLDASLESASKSYAPEHAKQGHCTTHDFTKNSDASNYYSPNCGVCVGYLEGDVISLWHTYNNARELVIETFGVSPGLTAGSTAMKAWQATIPEGHIYRRQHPDIEEFARNFCTGALVYPGCTSELLEPVGDEKYAAITVDRSAAFAACQKMGGYPVSAGRWTPNYVPEYFGLYECEAWCPRHTFPMVPLVQEMGGKLWSSGGGVAFVTSEQYEACLEQGYILKVKRGVFFKETEDVFGPFLKMCEDFEYPPDGSVADPAIKALAKRMRNSLNGKFNIKPVTDRLFIGDDFPVGCKPVLDDLTNCHPLYTIEEETDAPYCQPVWYAITVTRQMLEEHRLRLEMPEGTVFKFDTDSATSRPEVIRNMIERGVVEIGPGYGRYKVEHNWITLQSLGPKNYMGVEDKNGVPVKVGNCKGIPVKVIKAYREGQERAANGERVELTFESTRTLIDMFKSGLANPGIVRKRSISTPESVGGWRWEKETKMFYPHHRE